MVVVGVVGAVVMRAVAEGAEDDDVVEVLGLDAHVGPAEGWTRLREDVVVVAAGWFGGVVAG